MKVICFGNSSHLFHKNTLHKHAQKAKTFPQGIFEESNASKYNFNSSILGKFPLLDLDHSCIGICFYSNSLFLPPILEDKSSGGNRGFKSILDGVEDDDYIEESGQSPEKKRRLTTHQVKALEKNFEVENKLEPERKVKLAEELGLQPRQVAVWFQNRRARWKTKQLEKEYGLLKANYEALNLNYDSLHQENEALLAEVGWGSFKFHEKSSKFRFYIVHAIS